MSAIVTGDSRGQRVAMQIGAFDRIAMDRNHAIYLRHAASSGEPTSVSKWKADTDELETQTILEPNAEPIVSDGILHWKPHGSSNRHHRKLAQGEQALTIPERRLVLGLPGQRYMVFGTRTEEIMVFDVDGTLVATARADLDAAYATLGLEVPKPDVESGRSRVVSAASSRHGLLYVQLSETPVTRPTPVAVFDPTDGRLLRVLNAVHPTAEPSIPVNDLTPVGLPYLVAIDDELVVVYGKGYLAFY